MDETSPVFWNENGTLECSYAVGKQQIFKKKSRSYRTVKELQKVSEKMKFCQNVWEYDCNSSHKYHKCNYFSLIV